MDTPPCAFVIFGITGDLSARKLMPALYALHRTEALNPETQIVGFSRRDWSDDDLREEMKKALQEYDADNFDEESWGTLAPRFSFVSGSYTEAETFKNLKEHLDKLELKNHIFYTSTPPGTYEAIVENIGKAGLNKAEGSTRLVIEKPFGHDLESAKKLNDVVQSTFEEDQIYRIDHYLAKETAQNIAALRFANTIFEPTWSAQYVDHVQVTMAEPIGIGGRGSFYEDAGVIRDVFQNHLLQLVALTATEPPSRYDAKSVRDEKVKVFQAMSCVNPSQAVIGQYAGNGEAKAYRAEEGVAKDSRQGTYAAVELRIENWRWAGVPFFVRGGKRLKSKSSEIVVVYRRPPHVPFQLEKPVKQDRMILRLVPNEGITLRFDAKRPGQGINLTKASMDFYYDQEFNRGNPDAYETLIQDAMMGDPTLFMRADEVESQWRIVKPLLEMWENSNDEPAFYEPGTWGPDEANELLASQGRSWHTPATE